MIAYAGIGSRKTPPDVLSRMTAAAARLARMGFVLRSGGADGADLAFEAGAGEAKEVFLPWRGFNGSSSPLCAPSREAFDLAATVHPGWERLSPAVRKLMARNCHQVLGADLESLSAFVVCWTPDACETEAQRGSATGGTGQAIALANRKGIPVFNLASPDAGERLLAFIKAESP